MQSIFLAMRWIFWPSLGGSSRSSLLQWLEMFSPFFLCWCYVLPSLNGGGVAFEVIWDQNEIITLASGLWKISCSLCTDIPGFLGFLLKDRSLLALISFRWCDLVWLLGGSRSAWGSAPLPQQQLYRLSEITGSNVFRALQVALPSWAIAVPGARPCAGLCIIFTKTLAAGVNSSCTCQDFYPRSSSPFLHRLLSYTGCNTEAVTCSNPLTLQIADKQIKICFNMYALSGVSWWVRKFVYCWQCLMEAAAITCEGPAIFSRSQTKIQPWRQVVGCSLYINPQLPCFKVNEVFRASEVVWVVKQLGSNAAQTYQISDFTASISSVWKHLNCALLHHQYD